MKFNKKRTYWSIQLYLYLYKREYYKERFNKRKDKEWEDYWKSRKTRQNDR